MDTGTRLRKHLPSRQTLHNTPLPCGNQQSKGAITPNHSPQVTNSPALQALQELQEAGPNLLAHIKETTLCCLCCQRVHYGSNLIQIPQGRDGEHQGTHTLLPCHR